MHRSLHRSPGLLLVVLGCLLGSMGLAQEAPTGPIIELPRVVVTDSRDLPPPERWRYAEIPGFEVLTNASDRDTQKLIQDFQSFNFAVDVVWRGLQQKTGEPISLIICGRGGKFDAFAPRIGNSPDTGRASLLLQEREKAAIVLDFQAKTIQLSNLADAPAGAPAPVAADAEAADADAAVPGANSGEMEVDAYKQLYREYLRHLMSRAQPRFPAWFEEGLAQLFMGMTFDSRTITFAKLEDPNLASLSGGVEDRDFNKALEGRALMPLQEMFSIERGSSTATNPLGSIWAKQSQAFVHLCLYGEGQRYQKGLITLLLRIQKEPVTEKLFRECFNKSYQDMLGILRGYQQFTAYKSLEWRLPKGQSIERPPLIALREATQAEIGRVKGEALRLAGQPAAAHTALIAPYVRGERDPRLLAALGLEELSAGHDDRAEKFLTAATTAKVERPRAYLELARIRYQASLAAASTTGDRFSDEQVSQIMAPLLVGRTQSPALPEIYELMSDTLVRGANVPAKETIALLYD
ncbi:MAG: hypothetical protein ABIZ81_03295, partial [Opitutaceae bacterium]